MWRVQKLRDGACTRSGGGVEVIKVREGREEGVHSQIKEQVVPWDWSKQDLPVAVPRWLASLISPAVPQGPNSQRRLIKVSTCEAFAACLCVCVRVYLEKWNRILLVHNSSFIKVSDTLKCVSWSLINKVHFFTVFKCTCWSMTPTERSLLKHIRLVTNHLPGGGGVSSSSAE